MKSSLLFFLVYLQLSQAEYILFVNFTNYSNPTGLCAECITTLDRMALSQIVPVCCDQLPLAVHNCINQGNAACDTRFRWKLREYGATVVSRPISFQELYDYSLCTNETEFECPVSRESFEFNQSSTAFLGWPNPLPIYSNKPLGRVQLYIEPVESMLPNIIDSIPINLRNLELGSDFTEEMMFTGFHNISTMTMSFRVECSPGFCGPDCTITPTNNPLVAECQTDGSVTCVDSKRDSSLPVPCSDCLYNLNNTTNNYNSNCSTLSVDSSGEQKCNFINNGEQKRNSTITLVRIREEPVEWLALFVVTLVALLISIAIIVLLCIKLKSASAAKTASEETASEETASKETASEETASEETASEETATASEDRDDAAVNHESIQMTTNVGYNTHRSPDLTNPPPDYEYVKNTR